MLLHLSLWKGEVYTSYAMSLFLRVERHLSRRTDDFCALSGKKTALTEPQCGSQIICSPLHTQKQTCC